MSRPPSRPLSRPPSTPPSGSSRPPLTLALSAVIAAQVEHADRPGLLATLHPRPPHPVQDLRVPVRPEDDGPAIPRPRIAGPRDLARVIPLPRVIPMLLHRHPESEADLFPRDLDPRLNPDLDSHLDRNLDPDLDPDPSSAA